MESIGNAIFVFFYRVFNQNIITSHLLLFNFHYQSHTSSMKSSLQLHQPNIAVNWRKNSKSINLNSNFDQYPVSPSYHLRISVCPFNLDAGFFLLSDWLKLTAPSDRHVPFYGLVCGEWRDSKSNLYKMNPGKMRKPIGVYKLIDFFYMVN